MVDQRKFPSAVVVKKKKSSKTHKNARKEEKYEQTVQV